MPLIHFLFISFFYFLLNFYWNCVQLTTHCFYTVAAIQVSIENATEFCKSDLFIIAPCCFLDRFGCSLSLIGWAEQILRPEGGHYIYLQMEPLGKNLSSKKLFSKLPLRKQIWHLLILMILFCVSTKSVLIAF